MFKRILINILLVSFAYNICISQNNTLRIMYYNILNYPGKTPERSEYFRKIIDYIDPDIIALCEIQSDDGVSLLLHEINKSNNQFSKAKFIDGKDTDNILLYKMNKVKLMNQDTISTALRLINKYSL